MKLWLDWKYSENFPNSQCNYVVVKIEIIINHTIQKQFHTKFHQYYKFQAGLDYSNSICPYSKKPRKINSPSVYFPSGNKNQISFAVNRKLSSHAYNRTSEKKVNLAYRRVSRAIVLQGESQIL